QPAATDPAYRRRHRRGQGRIGADPAVGAQPAHRDRAGSRAAGLGQRRAVDRGGRRGGRRRRQLPRALPAQRCLRAPGQAAGLRCGAPLRGPGERIRCRARARPHAVLSLPVSGAAARGIRPQLQRGRRARRAAWRDRHAAGDRGAQAAAACRRTAGRAPAAFRRAVDALPRDPAGARPGLPGLRAGHPVPRIYRLRRLLRGLSLRRQTAGFGAATCSCTATRPARLHASVAWCGRGACVQAAVRPCLPRGVPLLRLVMLCLLLSCLPVLTARASDPCMRLAPPEPQDLRGHIAAAACEEHRLWYRPFIEADGRIGVVPVREGQRERLANGQPAWQRVIEYWRGSGLLWQAGAGDCSLGDSASPACRAFVLDTPWSAAFVSWVMQRAGLPAFNGSASHLGYVRRAYREPLLNPYRVSSPQTGQVAVGDMLSSVRGGNGIYGFAELASLLSGNEPGLGMHGDIVVGKSIREDGWYAYLVGGNVLDSVTMRELPRSPGGRFAGLSMRTAGDPECTP